jgi:hypothetical protein
VIHLTVHQVSAHLDGALVGTSLDLVVRHLKQCEACRGELAALRAQDQVLARLIAHDPGEAWFEEFHEELERALSGDPPVAPKPAPAPAPEPEAELPSPRPEVETAPPLVPPIVPVSAAPMTPIVPRDIPGRPTVHVRPAPPRRHGGLLVGALGLLVLGGAAWLLVRTGVGEQVSRGIASVAALVPPAPAPTPVEPPVDTPIVAAPGSAETSTPAETPAALDAPPADVAIDPAEERGAPGTLPPREAPPPVVHNEATRQRERKLDPPASAAPAREASPPPERAPRSTVVRETAASIPPARGTTVPRETPPAARPVPPRSPSPSVPATLGLLCGQVSDEDGGPVVGAQVMMADAGVAVVTDRAGRFCVSAPVGERTVSVLAMGFKPARRVVTVAATGTDFTVALATAAPIAAGGARAPASTSGSEADPFATLPAPLIETARAAERLGREALGVGSPRLYDQSASEWERLIRSLGDGSERTEARWRLAEARYRAWDLDPSPIHRDAALAAVEAYIAASTGGTRQSEARGWRTRLGP